MSLFEPRAMKTGKGNKYLLRKNRGRGVLGNRLRQRIRDLRRRWVRNVRASLSVKTLIRSLLILVITFVWSRNLDGTTTLYTHY